MIDAIKSKFFHVNYSFKNLNTLNTRATLKRIRCLTVTLFVTAIIILVTSTFSVQSYLYPSLLANYNITSRIQERPSFFLSALKEAKILGINGGFVSLLDDDTYVWIFTETIINCTECISKTKIISNTYMKLRRENGSFTKAQFVLDSHGYPKQFVPFQRDQSESVYSIWPTSAFYSNDQIYIHWQVVDKRSDELEPLTVAFGYGTYNKTLDQLQRLYPDDKKQKIGVFSTIRCNDYIYMYMIKKLGWTDLLLSRLKEKKASLFHEQQHWTGFSYSEYYSVIDSPPLFKNIGPHLSVAFNEHLQRFIMIEPYGRQVIAHTAPAPQGPWSVGHEIFHLPDGLHGEILHTYFHPELFKNKGKIMYFSFCLMEGNSDNLPYFVRVEMQQ